MVHTYCRACVVLIEVKLSVLEKLALPVITTSPMVTIPMPASAFVTGTEFIPLITTSQSSCGVITSLSGPMTMQVSVKLSPAVGIPGIDMLELNAVASSTGKYIKNFVN